MTPDPQSEDPVEVPAPDVSPDPSTEYDDAGAPIADDAAEPLPAERPAEPAYAEELTEPVAGEAEPAYVDELAEPTYGEELAPPTAEATDEPAYADELAEPAYVDELAEPVYAEELAPPTAEATDEPAYAEELAEPAYAEEQADPIEAPDEPAYEDELPQPAAEAPDEPAYENELPQPAAETTDEPAYVDELAEPVAETPDEPSYAQTPAEPVVAEVPAPRAEAQPPAAEPAVAAEVVADDVEPAEEVASFDFEAPLPLPATAPRLVARVQDVSPRIGVALSVACGRTVVVTCTGAERVSASHLSQAGLTWAYADCGLLGKTVLAVPQALTVALADTLMGGSGVVAMEKKRPSTTLEQRLVLRHLGPALQPLVIAFAGNGMTQFRVGEPETQGLPSSIGDLVALRLQTDLEGVQLQGTITVALPARALLPGAVDLKLAEPPTATAAALGEVSVEISLRLSPATLSAAAVDELCPGDVVRLEHVISRPLIGLLDDQPILHATLGRRGRRRAVLVTDLLRSDLL